MTRRKPPAVTCGAMCPTKAHVTCILAAGHGGDHRRYADGGGDRWSSAPALDLSPSWPVIRVDNAAPQSAETRPASAWKSADSEIERQVAANTADRRLRARIVGELRGDVAAWGLSLDQAADILENVAQGLRADAEAFRRSSRRGGR